MERRFIKICSILLLSISTVNYINVFADNNENIQNEIDNNNKVIEDLEKEQQDIREQLITEEIAIADIELSIRNKRADVERARADIEAYQSQIDILQSDIDNIENEIEQTEYEIWQKEEEINRLIKEKKTQEGLLSNRIRNYYKIDISNQYIYILLNSENIFDFLANLKNITRLMEIDKNLIKSKKENEAKITEEKEKIVVSLSEQEARKKSIVDKQSELIEMQGEFIAIKEKEESDMYELQILEGEKKYIIASLEAQENNLQGRIEDLLSYNQELQEQLNNIFENIENDNGSVVPPVEENDYGFLRPVDGIITCEFGPRINPVTFEPGFHNGIDYAGNTGESIRATKSGIIEYSGWIEGYGNTIIINHGNGVKSLYAHASQLVSYVGQTVAQGETVALIGSTGMSTGPHLHFEIRIDGQPIDPFGYIPY